MLLTHMRPPVMRLLAPTLFFVILLAGCSSGDEGGDVGGEGGGATGDPATMSSAPPAPSPVDEPPAGMVVYVSDADVETTVGRVQDAFDRAGSTVATVDHAAAGARADIELPPTVVVIGGSPEVGTPVMQAQQTTGVDLPLKMLVWEQDDEVYLGYNSADYLAATSGLDPQDPSLAKVAQGSATIAAAAGGSDEPAATGEVGDVDPEEYLRTVAVEDDADVATVVERLRAAFDETGLASPATVDHAATADTVGLSLRPTVVTFGGNATVLPRLMQARQTTGIDMPLRFLVWQAEGGTVQVSYPDLDVIAARHGLDDIDGVSEVLDTVRSAEDDLANTATER